MKRNTGAVIVAALTVVLQGVSAHAQQFPFQNPDLPTAERVRDLVGRMTLEEKISQMQNSAASIPRLGIPEYNWWNEALHGVARNGIATVFPQAIGMAATWNPDLIHREAEVIATEARAKHHEDARNGRREIYTGLTFWSPNINIFRDPRWGRGQETYGEDPFLTARMGVAFVKGLQGTDPRTFKTIATPKHYAVHSGPESLRHQFDARPTPEDLYDTYLPAFEACIREGGAWSIMGAYNRTWGEPCCASTLLLKNVLREKWGFKGYVVSDCGAIYDIYSGHNLVPGPAEASAMAVKSGCDLTCGTEYTALTEAVAKGFINEADIDIAVGRLMEARIRLGMFDPPERVPYASIPATANNTPENSELALRVARESIVLLQNDRNALPLQKNLGTVAVIGPTADDSEVLLGNYNGTPAHPVTILQGIRNKLGPATRVLYTRGSDIAEGMVPPLTPIPPALLRPPAGEKVATGLRAEFFSGRDLKGAPLVTRMDSTLAFDWGDKTPDPAVPADNFSARWTGTFVPDRSGRFLFGATVDDGLRVFVDGKLLLEEWKDGAPRPVAREFEFVAGRPYAIVVEFYEHGGGAAMTLGWTPVPERPSEEALAIARQADHVIMVLGLSPRLEGEEMSIDLKGFKGGDRTDITLPSSQEELLQAVFALGKPMTLVLTGGSALAVGWANAHLPAIVEAWYPGQQGGTAVADVLFGDYNPAGRLPVTFYASVNDLPPFEQYAMAGRTYRYFAGTPLYPFGHGLSYSQFDYRSMTVSPAPARSADTLTVDVTVANTGSRDGDEVVQLYVRPVSPARPGLIKALKGFHRVAIAKGATRTVRLRVPVSEFRRFDASRNDYVIDPGSYEVQVGASSSDIRLTRQVKILR